MSVLTALLKGSQENSELLFLVAIYFHTNQHTKLLELVRDTIQMPVSINTQSLFAISELFTKEIYTEKVIAQRAVALDVIPNVSFMPIHCIFGLIGVW